LGGVARKASVKPVKASFLARPEFKADPYPFYARMREEAPAFRLSIPFPRQLWLLTRYDDIVGMLKDERLSRDLLAKLPWFPRFARPLLDNMLGREPPDHGRLRKLVSMAFTPRRIDELRGEVERVCEDLLSVAPSGRPFDLVADYALPLPLTVIAGLLGVPPEDRKRFHSMVRGSLPLGVPTGSLLDIPRALPSVWQLMRYFRGLFAERRLRPRDDLFSALVQAEQDGDRLSADELLGTAMLLVAAGYETTVHVIASGALALLQNPDERARFVEGRGRADRAIEELLRYTSPVEMTTPRIALEDIPFASVTIPRGSLVSGVLGSANRDESHFVGPDRLDLGREPNKHVAFGVGHHFCLGASLARLEARIALTTLFRRRPALRLAQPADSLRWRQSLPLRALTALPVIS
jgi:cytochrome P450